jgi:hypothetical protein
LFLGMIDNPVSVQTVKIYVVLKGICIYEY